MSWAAACCAHSSRPGPGVRCMHTRVARPAHQGGTDSLTKMQRRHKNLQFCTHQTNSILRQQQRQRQRQHQHRSSQRAVRAYKFQVSTAARSSPKLENSTWQRTDSLGAVPVYHRRHQACWQHRSDVLRLRRAQLAASCPGGVAAAAQRAANSPAAGKLQRLGGRCPVGSRLRRGRPRTWARKPTHICDRRGGGTNGRQHQARWWRKLNAASPWTAPLRRRGRARGLR